MNRVISRARRIFVALIRATLLCERGTNKVLDRRSLAEKPKVRELQMDWLRSEDLKEEENVTAPIVIIAVHALGRFQAPVRRPLSMHRMNPERADSDRSGSLIAEATVKGEGRFHRP